MNGANFKSIRLDQLAKATARTLPIGQVIRPPAGWLRAVREALGLTLADLANQLKLTPPAVRSFERAEAEDRITLASLRRSAAAMDCELVYVLVPRQGTLTELAQATTRTHIGPLVEATEHTMRLEAQGVGDSAAKIETEVRRKLGDHP